MPRGREHSKIKAAGFRGASLALLRVRCSGIPLDCLELATGTPGSCQNLAKYIPGAFQGLARGFAVGWTSAGRLLVISLWFSSVPVPSLPFSLLRLPSCPSRCGASALSRSDNSARLAALVVRKCEKLHGVGQELAKSWRAACQDLARAPGACQVAGSSTQDVLCSIKVRVVPGPPVSPHLAQMTPSTPFQGKGPPPAIAGEMSRSLPRPAVRRARRAALIICGGRRRADCRLPECMLGAARPAWGLGPPRTSGPPGRRNRGSVSQ